MPVCAIPKRRRLQYVPFPRGLCHAREYNVYAAELSAIELAIDITQSSQDIYDKCIIYSDSQSAIKGVSKPQKQSGQSIIASALEKMETLKAQRRIDIQLVWIPGHMDILPVFMSENHYLRLA